MTIAENLINIDQQLFLVLNGWNTPSMDTLMYWVTYKFTWIPLYVILLVFLYTAYRKKAIGIVICIVLAVALADQLASGLLKPLFARLRPCHDPLIGHLVHLVTGCGGQYGFASSHASTSFALATSSFYLGRSHLPYLGLLFIWAAIYSYSRIYVGVHYPGDILAGAAIGVLSGWISLKFYNVLSNKLL